MAAKAALGLARPTRRENRIPATLMRPFVVVVTDELRNGVPKVPVSQRDQPVEALFLDGADEAFGMGIRVRSAVRRLNYAHTRRCELVPDRVSPLGVAVADQDPASRQGAVVCSDHGSRSLMHEQRVRMAGRAENLHPSGRQVDDEEGVVRDQAAQGPDLRGEEVSTRDGAPVSAQERLPGGRAPWHGWQSVGLEDACNRRTSDAVPDVCQRALDPGVAPRRILSRHPHDKRLDLAQHACPPRRAPRIRPLSSDQLATPAEERVRRDQGCDRSQARASQSVRRHRETVARSRRGGAFAAPGEREVSGSRRSGTASVSRCCT